MPWAGVIGSTMNALFGAEAKQKLLQGGPLPVCQPDKLVFIFHPTDHLR
jgi:hypothetical protein